MKKKALSVVLLLSCVQIYAADSQEKREHTQKEKNAAAITIQYAFRQLQARKAEKEKAALTDSSESDDFVGDVDLLGGVAAAGTPERKVSGDADLLDNAAACDDTGSDKGDNDGGVADAGTPERKVSGDAGNKDALNALRRNSMPGSKKRRCCDCWGSGWRAVFGGGAQADDIKKQQ